LLVEALLQASISLSKLVFAIIPQGPEYSNTPSKRQRQDFRGRASCFRIALYTSRDHCLAV